MRVERVSALLELIRWQGRGLRGDPSSVRGLLDSCYVGLEVGLPADLLLSGLCILDVATLRMGASPEAAHADFPQVCEYGRTVEAKNVSALGQIADRLKEAGIRTEDAILLGDCGVLLSLYGSVRAFRANNWVVGASGESLPTEDSVTEFAVLALPFEVTFGRLSRLEGRFKDGSRVTEIAGNRWRSPSIEMLTVFMAANVGEPEANPASNTWAHLAVALKAYKHELNIDEALVMAEELKMTDRVQRGLVIVGYLFPELRAAIKSVRNRIPALEKVALRLAANKLLREAVAEGE